MCFQKKAANHDAQGPTWKVPLWDFGNVEEESKKSNHIHHNHSGCKVLESKVQLLRFPSATEISWGSEVGFKNGQVSVILWMVSIVTVPCSHPTGRGPQQWSVGVASEFGYLRNLSFDTGDSPEIA